MQDRLLFVISPPRAGSTLLQHMLGSHSQIATYPEPHLITPLAYLGYHDLVDKAPYDHINAAEAIRAFVDALPRGEDDYLDALRAYADTLYGRMLEPTRPALLPRQDPGLRAGAAVPTQAVPGGALRRAHAPSAGGDELLREQLLRRRLAAANAFNPVVNRYVPAMARFLREPAQHLLQVGYESLVATPAASSRASSLPRSAARAGRGELRRALRRRAIAAHEAGSGDPIGVAGHARPVDTSFDKWVGELLQDDRQARTLAREIVAKLDADDVRVWGYEKSGCSRRSSAPGAAVTRLGYREAQAEQLRHAAKDHARAQARHRQTPARQAAAARSLLLQRAAARVGWVLPAGLTLVLPSPPACAPNPLTAVAAVRRHCRVRVRLGLDLRLRRAPRSPGARHPLLLLARPRTGRDRQHWLPRHADEPLLFGAARARSGAASRSRCRRCPCSRSCAFWAVWLALRGRDRDPNATVFTLAAVALPALTSLIMAFISLSR